MQQDEKSIVQSVLGGRVDDFRLLVVPHQEQVFGTVRRLVGDPDLAEELAHEAFVRAYRALSSFRGESTFGTWVTQIAVHLARDHYRRRRRTILLPLEEPGADERFEEALTERRSGFDPFEELEEQELLRRIERAIDGLPPDYRQVLVLRHLECWSYDEIARLTGDSVGALKVRAHRARRLVHEALEADEGPRRDRAALQV
jgi:RNA polymerase sigma-70 factor (ECF subfamily)